MSNEHLRAMTSPLLGQAAAVPCSIHHPDNQVNVMNGIPQPPNYWHPEHQPSWTNTGSQRYGGTVIASPPYQQQQGYPPPSQQPSWTNVNTGAQGYISTPVALPYYNQQSCQPITQGPPRIPPRHRPIIQSEPSIPDYLPLSIFVLLCLFCPIGICAVIGSFETRELISQGRLEEAKVKSKATLHVIIYGTVWGIVTVAVITLVLRLA